MRKGRACKATMVNQRIVGLITSVLMMWLCVPGTLFGGDNDVSADIEVTPGTHNLAIPTIPDGSEVSEITVTITAATGWNLVTLDPAPDGWFGTYQRLYDGMSPGEAYGGTFTGELEPEDEPVGTGGGETDYTFTVNATGTSVKPEFRIRPDELTVCVGEGADFVSEKRLDEASPWELQASNWTLGGNARPPAASSKTFVTNVAGVYAITAETNGLSDTAELTVVQVDLVKADSQAYTSPDIFPDICRNAQAAYKKAKWHAVVKPVGTKAKIFEVVPAYGGNADIELTAIDSADLANIEDGDEFWVEENGESGAYYLEIEHQDLSSCRVEEGGTIIAFSLELTRDDDGDYGAVDPSGDWEVSFDKPNGSASAMNSGDSNNQVSKGARVAQQYQMQAVSDMSPAGDGLKVKAEAVIPFASSGSTTIKNYPIVPGASAGLSASWGIVSFSFASGSLWTVGRSAAGVATEGYIDGNTAQSTQKDAESDDVGWSIDVIFEKTFDLAPEIEITDSLRTYTVGETEFTVQNRVDCLSSVKPGTFGLDTVIVANKQELDTPSVAEKDAVFELID